MTDARKLAEEIEAGGNAFILLNEQRKLIVAALRGETLYVPVRSAPNVDGRDFYELCQEYRHSKEIMPHPSLPNTVRAFDNLRDYIKTGKLPWLSYEDDTPISHAHQSTKEKS